LLGHRLAERGDRRRNLALEKAAAAFEQRMEHGVRGQRATAVGGRHRPPSGRIRRRRVLTGPVHEAGDLGGDVGDALGVRSRRAGGDLGE
jgi:hypothetical protein